MSEVPEHLRKEISEAIDGILQAFREAIRRAYGPQALEFISNEDAKRLHDVYLPIMSYEQMAEDDSISEEEYEEECQRYQKEIRSLRPILVKLASGNKSKTIMSMTAMSAFIACKDGYLDAPEGATDHELLIRFLVSDLLGMEEMEDMLDRFLIASFRFRVEF